MFKLKKQSNDFYFDVLGVNRLSTKVLIKKAFRDLIKAWHPDKFKDDIVSNAEATERSILIIEAYEILRNYVPPDDADIYLPSFKAVKQDSQLRQDIIRERVKSSNLYSVGYSIEMQILQIEYTNGRIYEYYDVPKSVFMELLNSESKGKYANRNICFSFRYNSF